MLVGTPSNFRTTNLLVIYVTKVEVYLIIVHTNIK